MFTDIDLLLLKDCDHLILKINQDLEIAVIGVIHKAKLKWK